MRYTGAPFRRSIRGRLALAFLLTAAVPLLVVAVVALVQGRETLRRRAYAQLTSVADLKQEQIESWLAERQADARMLAVNRMTQYPLTELLSPETPADRTAVITAFLTANLKAMQQVRQGYSQIAFVDTSGTVVIATDPALVGRSFVHDVAFEGTLSAPGGEFMRDIHLEPDTGLINMDFGHVVYAVDLDTGEELPEAIGAVIIAVNMDETIYPLIRAWPGMGETGETLLIRREGDETLFLNNLRFGGDAALSLRIPRDSPNARPAHLSTAGQEGIIETPDYRGVQVLAAYRHISPVGWGFVAKQDAAEAFAPTTALTAVIALVGALTLAAAIVLTVPLARGLAGPVVRLGWAARQIAAGDLDVAIVVEGEDEIGGLAAAFADMVARLKVRDREQAALLRLSRVLIATLDLQTVMDEAVRVSVEVLGCEAGALLLPDASCEQLHVEASLGWDEETLADVTIYAGQDTAAGYAFAHREPVIVPDMARETRFHVPETLLAGGLRSGLSVPMMLGDEVLGAMLVNSRHPGHFGEAEARLLSLIANQVAVAIQNARLFEETRRRLQELSALFSVSTALRQAKTRDEMLPIILDKTIEVVGADAGVLFLADECAETVTARAAFGEMEALVGQQHSSANDPIGYVMRTGELCLAPAAPEGLVTERGPEGWCDVCAGSQDFAQYICVPLRTTEAIIGVLQVASPDPQRWSQAQSRLLSTIAEMAGNAIQRAGFFEELEESYLQTVLALANAIDAKDSYTGGHGERLAAWAVAVARELGCSEEEIEQVRWGALLHDVGKIGVPDHILLKPSRLNDEEWAVMRRHPEIGAEIVEPVKRLRAVAPIIRHHQERWDGAGYPAGLKGQAIPLGARVLAVVDAYGAITDERVYRKGRSHEEALEELRRNAGTQFDPQVVEVFLRVVDSR